MKSAQSYQLFGVRASFKMSVELIVALRILICKNFIIYKQNHLSIEQVVINKGLIDGKDR